jgi:dTDP-4-amino-4,6-dideoxygalactose transaminase
VFEALRAEGIGVNLHYIPVYLQPYYQGLGFKKRYCLEAEDYYAHAISLPMYPNLTYSQQDAVIESIRIATSK